MKLCEQCKTIHDEKYGTGRFCSSHCSHSYVTTNDNKSELKKVNCIDCNKSLEVNKRASSKNARCKSCKDLRKQNTYTTYKHSFRCKHCNQEFLTNNIKQIYCSGMCWNNFQKKHLDDYRKYRHECKFKFNVYDYPDFFDLNLIEKHGWYKAKNRGDNLYGISRDHRISIKFGFENEISSEIIQHPANCKLMLFLDNTKKNTNCDVTLDELLTEIQKFNNIYNAR